MKLLEQVLVKVLDMVVVKVLEKVLAKVVVIPEIQGPSDLLW